MTEKAIPEQRVMAGRVSVADSVARVALVTMEEAEQLDIELDTLGHDLWALEQRATLGARVTMVEEALNTLQQFVAVTKQAVADALVSRSAPPPASSHPSPGAASGTPTSPAVTPDTGATAASIRRGRSFSRGRNKMSGKWGDLAEESDTEDLRMQGTRGRDDARGSTDVDVAETPVIIALPDIVIPDTPVPADMPVILGITGSAGTSAVNLATLGVPPKRMPAEMAQTFKSPPAKAVQPATLAVRDVPARGTVALSLPPSPSMVPVHAPVTPPEVLRGTPARPTVAPILVPSPATPPLQLWVDPQVMAPGTTHELPRGTPGRVAMVYGTQSATGVARDAAPEYWTDGRPPGWKIMMGDLPKHVTPAMVG